MAGDRTNAERQRRYIARLKAQAAKAGVSSAALAAATEEVLLEGVAALKQELTAARARIAELEHGQARAGASSAAEDELRAEIVMLKTLLAAWNHVMEIREGLFTRSQFNTVLKCLHADKRRSITDDEINKAFNIFWPRRYAMVANDEMPVPKAHKFTLMEMDWMRERKARVAAAAKRAAAEARRGKRQPTAPPKSPRNLPRG